MEKQLIATAYPCMKAFILPANGDVAYQGHVINLEQDVKQVVEALPARIEDVPNVIVVQKENPAATTTQQQQNARTTNDFRVRRDVVLRMITCLRLTNPVYFNDIPTDVAALASLPEDGSVFDRVPQVDNDQVESYSQLSPDERMRQNHLNHLKNLRDTFGGNGMPRPPVHNPARKGRCAVVGCTSNNFVLEGPGSHRCTGCKLPVHNLCCTLYT